MELNKYKPALIYNWDEAFLSVDGGKTAHVCSPRDKKPTVEKAKQNSEHITVGCV